MCRRRCFVGVVIAVVALASFVVLFETARCVGLTPPSHAPSLIGGRPLPKLQAAAVNLGGGVFGLYQRLWRVKLCRSVTVVREGRSCTSFEPLLRQGLGKK